MKIRTAGCIAAIILIPGIKVGAVSRRAQLGANEERLVQEHSVRRATVIAVDGTAQTVTVEGAGCTQGLCSRIFLRGEAENGAILQPFLYSIAAIKNITASHALFVMRNGSELRLRLVPDFRVLYLTTRNGFREKLDISNLRSLKFLDSGE